jgi:protein-S-isoprenylcysteine O-methyltransferase Ste14
MKNRDYTPLIMWFCLVAGIIILALIRPDRATGAWNGSAVNLDTVFIGCYLAWLAIELRVTKRDLNTEGRKTADFATCQLYGAGQALTVLTALWFPSLVRTPGATHGIGLAIFLLGVGYRLWAIRTLGRFYSHRVRTAAQHQIVDTGPYRFTRHPAYAGMIAANAGICIYFINWATLAVFSLILVPAILFRIAIEERTLFGIEGYREFAERRKRLFPGVW